MPFFIRRSIRRCFGRPKLIEQIDQRCALAGVAQDKLQLGERILEPVGLEIAVRAEQADRFTCVDQRGIKAVHFWTPLGPKLETKSAGPACKVIAPAAGRRRAPFRRMTRW
jgi:hypothetical protein